MGMNASIRNGARRLSGQGSRPGECSVGVLKPHANYRKFLALQLIQQRRLGHDFYGLCMRSLDVQLLCAF